MMLASELRLPVLVVERGRAAAGHAGRLHRQILNLDDDNDRRASH